MIPIKMRKSSSIDLKKVMPSDEQQTAKPNKNTLIEDVEDIWKQHYE